MLVLVILALNYLQLVKNHILWYCPPVHDIHDIIETYKQSPYIVLNVHSNMHSSRYALALVRLRRSLPPSVCSVYLSIVLLVGSVFYHADFTFLHQGYSHLFAPLCHFLHAVVLSLFPPCCVLLSFGVLIRLSAAVACHQSFEVCSLSFECETGCCFHISPAQICNFLLSVCHHVLSPQGFFFLFFFFSLYKLTQPISNGSVGFCFSSSLPISVSEGTWMMMFFGLTL